jgi:hypothetical protein
METETRHRTATYDKGHTFLARSSRIHERKALLSPLLFSRQQSLLETYACRFTGTSVSTTHSACCANYHAWSLRIDTQSISCPFMPASRPCGICRGYLIHGIPNLPTHSSGIRVLHICILLELDKSQHSHPSVIYHTSSCNKSLICSR